MKIFIAKLMIIQKYDCILRKQCFQKYYCLGFPKNEITCDLFLVVHHNQVFTTTASNYYGKKA